MYPKDCCKIQPSDANHIPTHYIHIIQSCHHIVAPHFVRRHKFDNIAYNIIPFVSMWFASTIVFLQLSPATSIGILYNLNIYNTNKKLKTYKFRMKGRIILK